jgi:hypothetical protein
VAVFATVEQSETGSYHDKENLLYECTEVKLMANEGSSRMTESRFEIEQGGHVSYLAYETDGSEWISLLYTEVAAPLRGRGIANDLARMAFEYAKSRQLKVEVICPVAFHFALKNPKYNSLILIRRKS